MTPVHLTEHGATLVIVGITISLHVAGMFGLSPVFGILSDRVGRLPTIALGQGLLVASLLTTSFGAESEGAVVTGLILLGLGWSASTVAGSALIAESADPLHRTRTQGRADLLMSAAGAAGRCTGRSGARLDRLLRTVAHRTRAGRGRARRHWRCGSSVSGTGQRST